MSDDEKPSPMMKHVKLLSALIALVIAVAGAAYNFAYRHVTIEHKLETAKEREAELERKLEEARRTRMDYEHQWMEQRPAPNFHFPAQKK